jgi:glutamate-1-semialdehyde 2,1-aminomutase
MTCLGKIIGGGMPLAAYGGRREIMEKVAPLGPVYQAGTLSGNPLSVAAALATLRLLGDEVYDQLEKLSTDLEAGLHDAVARSGVAASVQRVGSMITLFFHPGPIRSWDDAKNCDTAAFGKFHQGLIQRGIYWPPAQFEAAFVGASHTEADISATVEAAAQSLSALNP